MQLTLNAPKHHIASKMYVKHLESVRITRGAARVRPDRRLSDVVFAMLRGKWYTQAELQAELDALAEKYKKAKDKSTAQSPNATDD